MDRSIEIAITDLLLCRCDDIRDAIAENYIIGSDSDSVDGRTVRYDTLYDDEALEEGILEKLRAEIQEKDDLVDDVMNDFACKEGMADLINRAYEEDEAKEEIRRMILDVLERKLLP